LPNHAHFEVFLEGVDTLNNAFCHRNPQKTHPWVNPRRLMYGSCIYMYVHPFFCRRRRKGKGRYT